MSDYQIATIGYSGFGNDSDAFIQSLHDFEISALIDVRSSPYSAYYTAYNKEALEESLKYSHIVYRNYAREFGARQEDKRYYPHGYLDFELFAQSSHFQNGVAKIMKGMEQGYKFAFMCAEKEPVTCHRAILVARAFHKKGCDVIHILPENKTKSQEDIEKELLSLHPRDLFDDESIDDIELAYRKQNELIGIKLEDLT